MKLGLGTAQFGMPYGLTNASGRVACGEAEAILRRAADGGVDLIDTAAAYGDAETALGALLWRDHPFRIVSKLPPLSWLAPGQDGAVDVEAAVAASLGRLRQERIYGLLLHRAADLFRDDGAAVLAALLQLRESGSVAKVGVSVYDGAEIDAVLDLFTPDIVQLPLNVLDQRLLQSGHVARLADRSVEIHVRSVFLQGALLVAPTALPGHFSRYLPVLRRFHDLAQRSGAGPLGAALGFVSSVPAVHAAVVGVTSCAELDGILAATRAASPAVGDWSIYACDDDGLVNPTRWPAHAPQPAAATTP